MPVTSYPTWELGFYGPDGCQAACINLQATIHPEQDSLAADEIVGILQVSRDIARSVRLD